MLQLLTFADQQYKNLSSCPENRIPIDCYGCISPHFYNSDGNEKYNCIKGLSHYILYYGPCYASGTYHFLESSNLLVNYSKPELKVLSLGCGFSPDYYAFKKYIADKNLQIQFSYTGIELHNDWDIFHQATNFADKTIIYQDILNSKIENIESFDLIFMDKFFSSLSEPDGRDRFIKILKSYIELIKSDTIVIFEDVNSQDRGREKYEHEISRLFKKHNRFKSRGYGFQYNSITNLNNIFAQIPQNISIIPKDTMMKEVFFIYKNKVIQGGNP